MVETAPELREEIEGMIMIEIKCTLKEVMEQKNVTVYKLEELTGIKAGRISDYKCGRYIPSAETLCILSNALGCEINDLIKYEEIKK